MRKLTVRLLLTTAVATALSAVLAPVASADNESYLTAVNGPLSSKDGPEGLLAAGKDACRLMRPNSYLMFGRSANVVAGMVWEANPLLERDQATLLVNAAIDHLCPGVNPFGYAS